MAPGLEESAAHTQAIAVFLPHGIGDGIAALVFGFTKIDRYAKRLEGNPVEPGFAKDIGLAGIGTCMDDEAVGWPAVNSVIARSWPSNAWYQSNEMNAPFGRSARAMLATAFSYSA
jgi:hypothetical protein